MLARREVLILTLHKGKLTFSSVYAPITANLVLLFAPISVVLSPSLSLLPPCDHMTPLWERSPFLEQDYSPPLLRRRHLLHSAIIIQKPGLLLEDHCGCAIWGSEGIAIFWYWVAWCSWIMIIAVEGWYAYFIIVSLTANWMSYFQKTPRPLSELDSNCPTK